MANYNWLMYGCSYNEIWQLKYLRLKDNYCLILVSFNSEWKSVAVKSFKNKPSCSLGLWFHLLYSRSVTEHELWFWAWRSLIPRPLNLTFSFIPHCKGHTTLCIGTERRHMDLSVYNEFAGMPHLKTDPTPWKPQPYSTATLSQVRSNSNCCKKIVWSTLWRPLLQRWIQLVVVVSTNNKVKSI